MDNNKKISFLKKSLSVAKFSKDNSTKVGAFFVGADNHTTLGFGYNGMPRGMNDEDETKHERPEKYFWFEHAERNGIYNIAQKYMNNAMIFCTDFPDIEGARAIVSSGIKTMILTNSEHSYISPDREKYTKEEFIKVRKNVSRVLELFVCADVEIVFIQDLKISDAKKANKYKNYMNLAKEYGEDFSHKFADKKSGCLILNKETLSHIAFGYSGPPENLEIEEDEINENNKNFWIQEPEKNAIFDAVRPYLKDAMAYVSWCPCAHCSLAIASVGMKKVITLEPDYTKEADLRWKDSFEHSQKLFKKLGLEIELIKQDDLENKNTVNKNIKNKM